MKFAGDCLIIVFQAEEDNDDDEGGGEDDDAFAYWKNAKECARALLDVIKQTSDDLDLHGGLDRGNIQRIHLKDLRAGSPRTRSARQRLQDQEDATMSSAELEKRRSRWFCVSGRPLKLAGALLDKSAAGQIKVAGGEVIDRTTKVAEGKSNESNEVVVTNESKNENKTGDTFSTVAPNNSGTVSRGRSVSRLSFSLKTTSTAARAYLPPIVRAKFKGAMTIDGGSVEHRNVVIAFISLPGIFKQSSKAKGVDVAHLNDTYSALLSICSKHEGILRDFLFEDKGCTMICCWGVVNANEFDALRAVLFSLEALAALSTLKEKVKIGISGGHCLSCPIGNDMRRDWTVSFCFLLLLLLLLSITG